MGGKGFSLAGLSLAREKLLPLCVLRVWFIFVK
jgi:hypothetical protein